MKFGIDHIYILTCAHTEFRLPFIIEELVRIGLIESKNDDILSIIYGTKLRMYDFVLSKTKNAATKSSSGSSCTMAHYRIIQEASERKFNRVLILEDDERFLKDAEKVREQLRSIPEDADVVMLDWVVNNGMNYYKHGGHKEFINANLGKGIVKMPDWGMYLSSGAYILSARGQRIFLSLIESGWYPINLAWADKYKFIDQWFDNGIFRYLGIKGYIAVPNISIQSLNSSINKPGLLRLLSWYKNSYYEVPLNQDDYNDTYEYKAS